MTESSKQVIGVLTDAYSSHQQRVIEGIRSVLEPAGFGVLCIVGRELAPQRSTYSLAYVAANRLYKQARSFELYGLISLSANLSHNVSEEEFFDFLDGFAHLPRVSIGVNAPGIASVLVDNDSGMSALMQHLTANPEYKRFAFVKGFANNREAKVRERAFRDGLTKAGRTVDESLMVEGKFLMADSFVAVEHLLSQTQDIDVIVAANDEMAFGALQALSKHGLSVPYDVAVVGFDDVPQSSTSAPPLTTVRQPVEKQGELAAEGLLALLQGSEVTTRLVETELIVRRSCGLGVSADATSVASEPTRTEFALADHLLDADLKPLLEKFVLALEGDEASFLAAWQSYLYTLNQEADTLAAGQRFLEHLSAALSTLETPQLHSATRLLVRARAYLNEAALSLQAQRHFGDVQKGELQRRTQLRLASVRQWDALWESITTSLLKYGVTRCFVALFDNPGPQPADTALLQLVIQDAQVTPCEPTRFPGQELLPAPFKEALSQGILILEALSVGQDHFGFMLIDPRGADYLEFESLAHSISTALRNSVQLNALHEHTAQLERANQELAQLANYDVLTGLPNRVLFKRCLEQAFTRAQQDNTDVALLFLDLDGFKYVNDTLGHSAGDKLLGLVAERLKRLVEPSDTLARLGGDEFILILTELKDSSRCIKVAEAILEGLQPPFKLAERTVHITTSIGVTLYPLDAQDSETLLKHADMAMYTAKAAGKNRYHFYTSELKVQALEQLQLEQDMRAALEKGEFELYYQPRYDLRTRQIKGFEALLRWYREKGHVAPDVFIPLAEKTGFIKKLGAFAFREACQQAKCWQDAGCAVSVSVNLSVKQLQQETIVDELKTILDEVGLDTHLLELEVTESAAMTDVEKNITKLTALRELGIHIAIDDFGTGYSSLNYLKRLPVTSLKIDKSFVEDVTEVDGGDSANAAIIKAVVALGKSMGFKLIAEGVETRVQRHFLRSLGCEEAQGFLFSKALSVKEASTLLERASGTVSPDVSVRFIEPGLPRS